MKNFMMSLPHSISMLLKNKGSDTMDIILYELKSKISQESIIDSVKTIKNGLEHYKVPQKKIHDIYQISIEILQNILKYSYGSRTLDDKLSEADGIFIVKYNTTNTTILILSSNLIYAEQKETINQRVNEVLKLDQQAIKKLFIEKMKSKKDTHKKGAGLGFITIAQKTTHPIEVQFEYISSDIYKYTLQVVV